MTNPILSDWTTPFEIAPFAEISDDDFAPALEQALKAHNTQDCRDRRKPGRADIRQHRRSA